MKFVMMGWDGPEGEEKRKALRPGHLEQLKRLDSQGRLVLAGPFSDKHRSASTSNRSFWMRASAGSSAKSPAVCSRTSPMVALTSSSVP